MKIEAGGKSGRCTGLGKWGSEGGRQGKGSLRQAKKRGETEADVLQRSKIEVR